MWLNDVMMRGQVVATVVLLVVMFDICSMRGSFEARYEQLCGVSSQADETWCKNSWSSLSDCCSRFWLASSTSRVLIHCPSVFRRYLHADGVQLNTRPAQQNVNNTTKMAELNRTNCH